MNSSTAHCFSTSSSSTSTVQDLLVNSTFISRSLSLGDLYGFDSQCKSRNVSFVQIVTSSNQILLSSYWSSGSSGDVSIELNNCHHVRDDYHVCQLISKNTKSSTNTNSGNGVAVCVRVDDDISDDNEFEIAINFNGNSGCDDSFDFEAKCSLDSGSVIGMIMLIKYPGDHSIQLRNYLVAAIVILVILCCCCLASGAFTLYWCLIKRRREQLNKPFDDNNNSKVVELQQQED